MKNKKFSLLKSLIKIGIVALLLLVLFFITSVYYSHLFFPAATGLSDDFHAGGDRVNLVLLGFDRNEARAKKDTLFRPDVILVASIDMRRATVAMVSVPRDSYVKIHGQDIYDKINHSYMYGYYRAGANEDPDEAGIRTTVKTVEDFLGGLPLSGYLVVDMDGAAQIIDAVGGVYIDVKEDMRGGYGQGPLQIAQGYQLLDGKKVLQYTRNRADYLGGERGRTFRQQEVLMALFKKMVSPAGLTKMPLLTKAIKDNIKTDLNLSQLSALGVFGLRVDRQNIISRVFSGQGRLSLRQGQNIYFLVIDQEKRMEIIKEVFGAVVGALSLPELSGPAVAEPEFVPEEVAPPELVEGEAPEEESAEEVPETDFTEEPEEDLTEEPEEGVDPEPEEGFDDEESGDLMASEEEPAEGAD